MEILRFLDRAEVEFLVRESVIPDDDPDMESYETNEIVYCEVSELISEYEEQLEDDPDNDVVLEKLDMLEGIMDKAVYNMVYIERCS